jgi:hypothetical protein
MIKVSGLEVDPDESWHLSPLARELRRAWGECIRHVWRSILTMSDSACGIERELHRQSMELTW